MNIEEAEILFINHLYDEAFKAFKELGDTGEKRAFYFLAECCANGYGQINYDIKQALEYRYKGYELGEALCGLNLVYFLKDEEKKQKVLEEVIPKLRYQAESGDMFAQYELADYYMDTDLKKRQSLLEELVNRGLTLAMVMMGDDYLEGIYGKKDYDKAIYYYKLAVEKGDPEASSSLAFCFLNGYGVEKDEKHALELYMNSYNMGYYWAAFSVGTTLSQIEGKNLAKRIEWYEKGAKKGDTNCILVLIKILLAKSDFIKARSMICKAIRYKLNYDESELLELQKMQVDCSEGINANMRPLYEKVLANDLDYFMSNYDSIKMRDQMGVTPYHYAILLKRDMIVRRFDMYGTSLDDDIEGFNLISFGAGDIETIEDIANMDTFTFFTLLKLYDDEGRRREKKHKQQVRYNKISKKIIGVTSSLVGFMASNTVDPSTIKNETKREEYIDSTEQLIGIRESLKDKVKDLEHRGTELNDEYWDKNSKYTLAKLVEYANYLDKCVKLDSFKSKLIYLLIKKPYYLELIYHGEGVKNEIYEADGEFWYLPRVIIEEVTHLSVQFKPRKLVSFEEITGENNEEDYEEYYEDGYDDNLE